MFYDAPQVPTAFATVDFSGPEISLLFPCSGLEVFKFDT
jgi:hypothetical protein